VTAETRAVVETLGRSLVRLRSAVEQPKTEATAEDLYSRLRAHLTALTGRHARLTEMAGR
jgi:hypothetical protein